MTAERPSLSAAQVLEATRVREAALSRLLMAFVTTGLIFMVFPGTFLGVWNLLQISGRESGASISPAWLQAHGHAQVFGWVGSFILGIGFYSIPKMPRGREVVVPDGMGLLGDVDDRCGHTMGCQRVPVGVESLVADLRGPRPVQHDQ